MKSAELVATALIGAMLTFLLKELGFKGARLLSGVALVTLSVCAVDGIGKLIAELPLDTLGSLGQDAAKGIMKIIGVGYAFGLCSDVCREIGESGVASAVLAVGRVEILMISMPFVRSVFEALTEFLR